MGMAKDIMTGGFSAGQAKAIGGTVASTVTASGTIITDAFDLVASVNVVTTAASGSGVQIPSMEIGDEIEILNLGANAVKVYPEAGATINQLSANSAFTLGTNSSVKVRKFTATKLMAYLSA